MKFCVVGLGSIGQKHYKNLKELGNEVSAVSKSQNLPNVYKNLHECFLKATPDVVWVCNETSQHLITLNDLKNRNFQGIVLCEKPLFHKNINFQHSFKNLLITYQLRLHPLVKELKVLLQNQKVISGFFYVGQYLPDWRPSQDYRICYSATLSGGGGVLRDLSHEIDLSLFLIGKMNKLNCKKKKISDLEIETEDICLITGEAEGQLMQFHMNYLDRRARRFIIINTSESTFELDFIAGSLKKDGISVKETDGIFSSYPTLVSELSNNRSTLCSLEEAFYIQKVIETCDDTSNTETWKKL